MKKIILLSIIAVTAGCFEASVDPSKVVAKVGSHVYSTDDVTAKINELDPQLKEYFDKKENKVRLLDQLIDQEVMYQLAKKEGIDRTNDYKKILADMERQAVVNIYIEKQVNDVAEVTRSEVEAFYNENQDQFGSYESRNVSHILVKTKPEAEKVQKELKAGSSFASLAKKYSIDPSNNQGGELGWIRKNQLVPEFADAAYKLTNRAPVSGIVQTQYGFHLIQLNDVKQMPEQPLNSVYGAISEQLLSQKKRDKVQNLLTKGKESIKIERFVDNL
jgi:peptidyl-prolyl cis-trans isomerase C